MSDHVRRPPSRLVADSVVIVALCAVVVGVSGSHQLGRALPDPISGQVLTLVAAAVAAGAAILGALASRLLGDPRPRWIAAALAVYAVVVLPATALAPSADDMSVAGARLVAYLVTVGLLLAAIRPPARVGALGTWSIALGGAAVAGLALGAYPADPGLVRAVTAGPVPAVVALAGWTAVAAAVVIEGYRRRSTARWRIGLGLVVLAAAQLYRVLGPGGPATDDLVFGGLRLLGLAVVVAGLGQLVARTVADLDSAQFQQQEELTTAALHMERASELAAERDHELRNSLAGLAGITHLLSSDTRDEDQERLRHAVLAELGRLHRMLDGEDPEPAPSEYDVAPLLEGLVALRLDDGGPTLDAEPALRVRGDSAVLAQVVTNLLANCDRHAPGAPVRLTARRRGDEVVVEVRDAGPGLPVGMDADAALDRGVRDESAGGSGLGLYISGQLIAREGGTLRLEPVDDPRGCRAVVTLPAAYGEQSQMRTPSLDGAVDR